MRLTQRWTEIFAVVCTFRIRLRSDLSRLADNGYSGPFLNSILTLFTLSTHFVRRPARENNAKTNKDALVWAYAADGFVWYRYLAYTSCSRVRQNTELCFISGKPPSNGTHKSQPTHIHDTHSHTDNVRCWQLTFVRPSNNASISLSGIGFAGTGLPITDMVTAASPMPSTILAYYYVRLPSTSVQSIRIIITVISNNNRRKSHKMDWVARGESNILLLLCRWIYGLAHGVGSLWPKYAIQLYLCVFWCYSKKSFCCCGCFLDFLEMFQFRWYSFVVLWFVGTRHKSRINSQFSYQKIYWV